MSRVWDLPFSVPPDVLDRAAKIRLLLFDVDGVLTDGHLHYGSGGEEFKSFHVRDGHGIKMVRNAGIQTGLITARQSPAVDRRGEELGIEHVYQGQQDKRATLESLSGTLGLDLDQIAFTGDDIVDLPILLKVGLAMGVADGHQLVREHAHWVTPSAGGKGAVREICELVLYAQGQYDSQIEPYFKP